MRHGPELASKTVGGPHYPALHAQVLGSPCRERLVASASGHVGTALGLHGGLDHRLGRRLYNTLIGQRAAIRGSEQPVKASPPGFQLYHGGSEIHPSLRTGHQLRHDWVESTPERPRGTDVCAGGVSNRPPAQDPVLQAGLRLSELGWGHDVELLVKTLTEPWRR